MANTRIFPAASTFSCSLPKVRSSLTDPNSEQYLSSLDKLVENSVSSQPLSFINERRVGRRGEVDQALMSNQVPFHDTEKLGPADVKNKCFGLSRKEILWTLPNKEFKARDTS